jgi:broad specificity phosphatase PhoE
VNSPDHATEKWHPPVRRRLYLMRHGEVDYFDPRGRPHRPDEVVLNADGRRQAEAASRELAAVPLDRVITSGLPRAVETAAAVVGAHTLSVEVRPALREIEGGRLRDLENPDAAFLDLARGAFGPDTPFLGGETFTALRGRVLPCLDELLAEEWAHLLIVAHGVVNRVILGEALGAGLATLTSLEQDPGCINVLDVDTDRRDAGPTVRWLVRLVNHTPTDPLKARMAWTTMESLYLQYRRKDVR